MILSFVPIWIVDVCGSLAMIIFSFLCLRLAHELRSRDRSNVIWTYLLWFSIGLSAFAISRSAGHLLKQLLLLSGQNATWSLIQPFSGAINTLTFVFVGSVTLFFERVWNIYRLISRDKKELQETRDELLFVNQNPTLFSRFTVLPMQIFGWADRPEDAWRYNAALASVVLLCTLLALNGGAIYLRQRFQKRPKD